MAISKGKGHRLSRWVSKIVRAQFHRAQFHRAGRHCPIEEVDGFAPPFLFGEPAYYTTVTGKPILGRLSAYRRAYGRPVYHCSTVRIVVGRGWLAEQLAKHVGPL